MKKIKFCLAAAIVSLSVLSGCGMARDGYIEDRPYDTPAPVESPVVTAAPKNEKGTAEKNTQRDPAVEETPLPDAQQTDTPNM